MIALEKQLPFPRSRVWQSLTAPICLAAWHGIGAGPLVEAEEPRRIVRSTGRANERIEWILVPSAAGTNLRLTHHGVDRRFDRTFLRLLWQRRLRRLEALLPRVTERGLIPKKTTKYRVPALQSPWATVDLPYT